VFLYKSSEISRGIFHVETLHDLVCIDESFHKLYILNSCQKIFKKFIERSSILNLGCGHGGNHKKGVLMLSEICKISGVETHNAWTKMASMKKIRKGMTSFLVSYHRNQS
jgi:hypothetical protein